MTPPPAPTCRPAGAHDNRSTDSSASAHLQKKARARGSVEWTRTKRFRPASRRRAQGEVSWGRPLFGASVESSRSNEEDQV